MAELPILNLTIHPPSRLEMPLWWERSPVEGPVHGEHAPSGDLPGLLRLVSGLPRAALRTVRVAATDQGWFILLPAGEIPRPLGPFPLRRHGIGPFIYHPAEVSPVPRSGPASLGETLGGKDWVGLVREGQVRWIRLDPDRSVPLERFLRLPLPVRELGSAPGTGEELDPPWPRELPGFLAETLPKGTAWEREEGRRLAETPAARPGFWSRLFRRNRPPERKDWERLGKPPGFSLRGALRSWWGWVDRKLGSPPAGGSTGWLRKAFDPDHWGGGFLSKILDRQAQMFDRLARLFERGDLETALRHSIPIDNDLLTTLKSGGWLATGWRLPENPVDYSFGRLTRPSGGGGVAPAAPDQIARLSALYRKAADELSRQGRHRQAAYVYAHLLKDYGRAAQALEEGGFHLEAATLVKEKLGRKRQAAEILGRGGFVPEAIALYLEDGAYEEAAASAERAGMAREAARCRDLWVQDLRRRGHRVQAGDLLWRKMGRPGEARVLYDEELTAPRGMRGQAAARLAALGQESDPAPWKEWDRCEAYLRAEAEEGGDFGRQSGYWVTFHREVWEWARGREMGDPALGLLFRRTRESMLACLREAQRRNESGARGEAVAFLTEVLKAGKDPLAVQDLRRGLDIGITRGVGAARSRGRRRVPAGLCPLPHGRILAWVERRWAVMDGSGTHRSGVREMGVLPRAVAVHPRPEPSGSLLVGLISHDHRFTLLTMENGTLTTRASVPVGEAWSVLPLAGEGDFLVGTAEGRMVRVRRGKDRLSAIPLPDPEQPIALRWLARWGEGGWVLGGGDQGFDLLIPDGESGLLRIDRRAAPVTGVEHLAVRDEIAFLAGRDATFGYLSRREGSGGRIAGFPAFGVTSVGILEVEDPRRPRVGMGMEDGRLVLADLVLEEEPRLEVRAELSTSLGAIVAIQGLAFGRAIALDLDFRCAVVDLGTGRLAYQGSWEER